MKRKPLEHGQRANFYLKKDLPDEMLDWINIQSDLTGFVLYAMEELYKKTGFVDVASILPRAHQFTLTGPSKYREQVEEEDVTEPEKELESLPVLIEEDEEPEDWSKLGDFDDPYA